MLVFGNAVEEDETFEYFCLAKHVERHELPASEATFRRIIHSMHLAALGPWVKEANLSHDAPYHGSMHEMLMVCYAFMAAQYMHLGYSDTRCIIAAACLHDFMHTGVRAKHEYVLGGVKLAPELDDTVNIELAILGLEGARHDGYVKLSAAEWDIVARLIRCTRYPYLAEPTDVLERVLRDADLSMIYVDEPMRTQLFHGLYAELTASGRVNTLVEFAEGIVAFNNVAKLHTKWAEDYAEKHNRALRIIEVSRCFLNGIDKV